MAAFTRIHYYLNRIKQLGLNGLKNTIKHRVQKKIFAYITKKNALKKQAHHSWHHLATKHKLNPDFNLFFNQLTQQKFIEKIATSPDFIVILPPHYQSTSQLIDQANAYVQLRFDLLGSGPTQFETDSIPWQHDFKSYQTTLSNQANTFYGDITLPPPTTSLNDYSPDIKVPWELSRLQHIFVLGRAYQETKDDQYAQAFQSQINDWIIHNPYLLGVNWVCPMEVAIRAINLLWGFHFFKYATLIQAPFWETLICSLYDHAVYLENNEEWSDKPNNHYLADVLGYLYLCTFFKEIPHFKHKQAWCTTTLLEQFNKQIQADGTSYEGSTAYHKLDAEMYLHFMLLCKAENNALPSWVKQKFAKIILFLSDCTDAFGTMVTIGDDDSGKIVTGLKVDDFFRVACCSQQHTSSHSNSAPHLTTHENFGLTIIKQRTWHITFRHPTYTPQQPSGHFHQDQLAITLSIAGQPILVDPGSYVYTANKAWRNHFRSWQSHNTFYPTNLNTTIDQQDLFQLPRTPHTHKPTIERYDSTISVHDMHNEYAMHGITAHRTLIFDGAKDCITIEDWYQQPSFAKAQKGRKIGRKMNTNGSSSLSSTWTFIFHPEIELMQENNVWKIIKNKHVIAYLVSNLPFELTKGKYAPFYGTSLQTCTLTVTKKVFVHQKEHILIAAGA